MSNYLMEPVMVHWGNEVHDAAFVLKRKDREVFTGKEERLEPAAYVLGMHFGVWLYDDQKDAPDQPVWYEDSHLTGEHRKVAAYIGEEMDA